VAADIPFSVEILGIAHVKSVEGPGQSVLSLGDADKMHMIWHQTISPNLYTVSRGIFRKPADVASIIGFPVEYGLIVVPPLHEMVGISHDYGSGEAGH
jgi:hypothetical protein